MTFAFSQQQKEQNIAEEPQKKQEQKPLTECQCEGLGTKNRYQESLGSREALYNDNIAPKMDSLSKMHFIPIFTFPLSTGIWFFVPTDLSILRSISSLFFAIQVHLMQYSSFTISHTSITISVYWPKSIFSNLSSKRNCLKRLINICEINFKNITFQCNKYCHFLKKFLNFVHMYVCLQSTYLCTSSALPVLFLLNWRSIFHLKFSKIMFTIFSCIYLS